MTDRMSYLFAAATLRRERRDGRITASELARRLSDLVHDAAGIERPADQLDRSFTEALELANGGRS